MLLAEGAGPHVVIESISEGMQKSKVPLQQKAALSILLRLVNEFGAFALDLKLLFSYIKSDQCLLNSHVEVKNQAIEVLCVLYKQLGAVVRSLVEQSGISDLLKKSVMDSLDAVAYDPSAAAAYSAVNSATSSATSNAGGAVAQTASGSAQGVGAVSQGAMKPAVISVNDLIEPQDISGEVRPLLKKLATVEGKEAWKERQQGVLELTALLKQKVRVVNNAAVAEVVSALKQRLGETNLNLRAKVLLCISQLSEALGGEVVRYNATLLPDVLKLSNDSNKNVVEALYTLLTHWVSHDDDRTAAYLNSVLPFCGVALKQSKSPVPIELQQMADSFEAKVKEGNAKHRRSGYHTKGFKFDEAEAGEKEVIKNMQRRQVEVENGIISAEEAQQQEADEHTVREKFNIKLVNAPEEGEEDKGPSMQELLKKIDEEDSDNDDVFGHRENENGGVWGRV